MSIAVLALVISGVSLLLSLLLGAWDVVKYHRDGGRVRVSLQAGRLDSGALYRTIALPPLNKAPPSGLRFGIEVARITVENRGRTPVTVSEVVLDLGRTRWWPHRGRQTNGFPLLPFEEHATALRVRLQAYDAVSFLMDASHALPVIMCSRMRPLGLRASVRVAGVGITRSSWRRRWRLDPSRPARLWASGDYDLAMFVYQFVAWRFRLLPRENAGLVDIALGTACLNIARELEAGAVLTRNDLEAMMRVRLEGVALELAPMSALAAAALHDELEHDMLHLFSPRFYDQTRLADDGVPPSDTLTS